MLIADDHSGVRDGLARLLATAGDIEVLAAARDGEQAVALAAVLQPRVVLMDLSMPRMDGTDATRRIVATQPDTQVVILTAAANGEPIRDALDAGAVDYVLKDAKPAKLIGVIRAAAAAT